MNNCRNSKLFFLGMGLLLSLASCSSHRKINLFEGSPNYPWKVVYVKNKVWPVGKNHHYQVFYNNKALVIPKDLVGTEKDISEFVNANGFEIADLDNNAVLVTLKILYKKENGFSDYYYQSFFVRKLYNHGEAFQLSTIERERIGEFKL